MKIKICCISSIEEAEMAISAGATAIGLVGPMPSGPGIISNELIKEIVAIVGNQVDTFLLTSETTAASIIAHHQIAQTNTLQLVDAVPYDELCEIQEVLPYVQLVQVIHVLDQSSVREALKTANSGLVDALLLDSGNPNLRVKELGGTGRVHDWSLSRQICSQSPIPVYLAGGLRSTNAQQAIHQTRPSGLDVCSGVRKDGQLNQDKLTAFITAVRSIDAS